MSVLILPMLRGISGPPIMWEYDFTSLPLSNGSNGAAIVAALAAKGLSFSRASQAAVQVGAQSLVLGIPVDEPRVGQFTASSADRGLLMEPTRTNQFHKTDPNNWAVLNLTKSAVSDPAGGTLAARAVDADAVNQGLLRLTGVANVPSGRLAALSCWLQDQSGSASIQLQTNLGLAQTIARPLAAGWNRYSTTGTANTTASSTTNLSPAVGGANQATVDFAFPQYEAADATVDVPTGAFPTSFIQNDNGAVPATRAMDKLSHATPSLLIPSTGSIGLEFRIKLSQPYPSVDPAYSGGPTQYLFQLDPGGGAPIWDAYVISGTSTADVQGNVYSAGLQGGTGGIGAGAAGFTASIGDTLDVWYAVTTTGYKIRYRVNGGTALGTAQISTAIDPIPRTGVMRLGWGVYFGGDAAGPCGLIQAIRFYNPGFEPAWAA